MKISMCGNRMYCTEEIVLHTVTQMFSKITNDADIVH